MKKTKMKKYFNALFLVSWSLFWILPQASSAVNDPQAGQFDCDAKISFDINPKTITDSQSVTISGTVTAGTVVPEGYVYNGYCMYPGLASPAVSQYLVSIFDKTSGRELFYISGLKLEGRSGKTSYQWTLPSRKIGVAELAASGLSFVKNLSIVAQVKAVPSQTGLSYYQLTESWPVSIAVNTSQTNMPEVIADKSVVKMGDTVNLSMKNAKAGWRATVSVSGKDVAVMSASPFALAVTEKNNFKDNSDNTVVVTLGDGTQLKNNGSITISVGAGAPGAQNPGATTDTSKTTTDAAAATDRLYNPIPEEDLTHAFLLVAQGFLAIIGAWAVMFIIVGGFQMVTAAGNEEAIAKAKKTITWAIIGTFVALLSFSIIAIVQNVLRANIKSTTVTTPKK